MFNAGDHVFLIDGSNNDPFNIGWVDDMNNHVGEEFVVKRMCETYDRKSYFLDTLDGKPSENDWMYYEGWLVPAETNGGDE